MKDESLGRIVALVVVGLFLYDVQADAGDIQSLGPIAALAIGYLLRDALRRNGKGKD